MMKKVIVSACLLGELCRYDAQTKKMDKVLEVLKGCEIIPFCPEAPLFGTPRQRINVITIDTQNKFVTDETNEDVTQVLQEQIDRFMKENPHADAIILKSKSPSCGLGTTPILNLNKEITKLGNGIAANAFLKQYPHAKISDENSL